MLKKLKLLTEDMTRKKQLITSFLMKFDGTEYVVIVRRFHPGIQKRNQYAKALLHIINADDISKELVTEANVCKLLCPWGEIRKFLEKPYTKKLGDLVKRFQGSLGQQTPICVNPILSEKERKSMMKVLLNRSQENEKIYCVGVKRDAEGQHRTSRNSEKAAVLVPDLYDRFNNDETISFCFSADPDREQTEIQILKNFAKKETEARG